MGERGCDGKRESGLIAGRETIYGRGKPLATGEKRKQKEETSGSGDLPRGKQGRTRLILKKGKVTREKPHGFQSTTKEESFQKRKTKWG